MIYPVASWAIGTVLFHHQAEGSLVDDRSGKLIGSELAGQRWTKPQYFHGRPSAAGKGYDATSAGGTNLGPTSKKLLDATKSAIGRAASRSSGCRPSLPRTSSRGSSAFSASRT